MKSLSIRYIQHHFAELIPYLQNGEEIVIRNRDRVFAKIIPWRETSKINSVPDFKKRLLKDFPKGAISVSTHDLLKKSRGER